jgi:hypothetical protein
MVTAELAIAVPALLLVLSVCLGAVAVVTARVRCIDAAAVAARLAARGESSQTVQSQAHAIVRRATVTVRRAPGGFVDVDVREHVRLPVVGGFLPGVTVAEHLAVPDESVPPADHGAGP